MDLQLADKTVLVTGAGQGLGRAIGLAFAQEGARVAFHYNSSAEGAQKAAAEVNAAGGAPMVLLLASPLSSWTTGQIISVNGGYAMP